MNKAIKTPIRNFSLHSILKCQERFKISNGVKILIISIAVFGAGFLFGNTARAGNCFGISSNRPIFEEGNFLPGDSSSGSVTFSNETSLPLQVFFEMVNYNDSNPLFGDVLFIKVNDGSFIILDKSLTEFKNKGGVFTLSSNGDKTLAFVVRFDKEAANEYNMIEENAKKEVEVSFDLKFTAACDTKTEVIPGMVAGAATQKIIPERLGRVLGAAITKTGGSIAFVLLLSFLIASICYLIYLKKRSKKNKENCDI